MGYLTLGESTTHGKAWRRIKRLFPFTESLPFVFGKVRKHFRMLPYV